MHKVYLVIEHDYEGYRVLHVITDREKAIAKMQEYITTRRLLILTNPKNYADWALDPNATFSYDMLEFELE